MPVQVFDKEDDDNRYNNDDDLDDIKGDLVDEAIEITNPASDGNKSDADDKTGAFYKSRVLDFYYKWPFCRLQSILMNTFVFLISSVCVRLWDRCSP